MDFEQLDQAEAGKVKDFDQSVLINDSTDDEIKAFTKESEFINHDAWLQHERINVIATLETLNQKKQQSNRHRVIKEVKGELMKDGNAERALQFNSHPEAGW